MEVKEILNRITVNEQSSIRIEADKILYFDPFRLKTQARDADIVFLTHAHFDHFSPEDIAKIRTDETLFVIPVGMEENLAALGVDENKIVSLAPGDKTAVLGFPVEGVPAYNPEKSFHPKENGWLGYIVTVFGTRIYIAGDTDVTEENKKISCDIAMLPIGGKYTMDANEAHKLAELLRPKAVIPIHYGTVVGSASAFDTFCRGLDNVVKKLG